MPPSPSVPGSESPVPPSKRRLSHKSKLLIAGLGFPTLLLILAAGYTSVKMPQARFVDRILTQANPDKWWRLHFSIDLPFRDEEKAEFYFYDHLPIGWKWKFFGNVKLIYMEQPFITPEDLRTIGHLPHLENLFVYVTPEVGEADLNSLTHLPNLKYLGLHGLSNFTDEGMETLSRIKSLQYLSISPMRAVTPAGYAKLQSLPNLRKIAVVTTTVTGQTMRTILDLPVLSELDIKDSELTDEATERLVGSNLKMVYLIDVKAPPEMFHRFADFEGLYTFAAYKPGLLPPDAFNGFAGRSKLGQVWITTDEVDPAMFREIVKIETLEHLALPKARITDADLEHLYGHPKLGYVNLPKHISAAAIQKLKSKSPRLGVDQQQPQD